MAAASPCPVCGLPIGATGPTSHDFDCAHGCRTRDRDAWDTARALQLAREIEQLLHEGGRPDNRQST